MTRRPPGDPADALATAHLDQGLGTRAANGAFIAIGGQAVRTALSLASAVVLARLLSPEDFGLVAMAAAFTGFCGMFADLGLATATVQRRDIDHATVSALFFVNLGAGALVALLAAAAAPVAASIFGEPRLGPITAALAVPIVLTAASAQHRAVLQRGMHWTALQRIELTAQIAAAGVAIMLAWGTPLGYWALVAQAWASAATGLVLTWQTSSWRPGRVRDWSQVRGALGLGLNLTGFNLVNYFHRQFDNILIGWRWGATELGHYTRAYGLLLLPLSLINGPTSSAVIPALSRVQHEPERWRALYLAALSAVVLASSLITALLIATAVPLIAILFGSAWSQSAQIFECLALSMFAATPLNSTGWIHVSTGRTDRMLKWGLAATPVIVLAFAIGLPFGASTVALAYSIAMWVIAVPGMAYAAHGTAVGLADMLRAVVPLSAAGVASAAAGLAAADATIGSGHSSIVSLLTSGCVTVGLYAPLAAGLVLRFPAYAPLRRRAGAWLAGALAVRAPHGVHSGARP